jgi:hypothetical protein
VTCQDVTWCALTVLALSVVPLVWQSYRQANEQWRNARAAHAAAAAARREEQEYEREAKRLHLLDRRWSIRWYREKVRELRRDRGWE